MKKVKKIIKVDVEKCTGCRACEIACSAFHAAPKFSVANPARSRIRVYANELTNTWVPVFASEFTEAECSGHRVYTINGREHGECTFCGASCPWRDLFKEPDSGLPLKCDMCEDDPSLKEPWCVQVCALGCLTYETKEEEVEEEEEKPGEMEIGLDTLVKKYGLKTVADTVARMTKGGN